MEFLRDCPFVCSTRSSTALVLMFLFDRDVGRLLFGLRKNSAASNLPTVNLCGLSKSIPVSLGRFSPPNWLPPSTLGLMMRIGCFIWSGERDFPPFLLRMDLCDLADLFDFRDRIDLPESTLLKVSVTVQTGFIIPLHSSSLTNLSHRSQHLAGSVLDSS